jgi:hypothetical protein
LLKSLVPPSAQAVMWWRWHHSGGLSPAGKGAAAVSGDQGQGLAAGGDAFGAAMAEHHAPGVMHQQVDRGFVGQGERLLDAQRLPKLVSASP